MKKNMILRPVLVSILLATVLSACNSGGVQGKGAANPTAPQSNHQRLKVSTDQSITLGTPAVQMASLGKDPLPLVNNDVYIDVEDDDGVRYSNEQSEYGFVKNMSTSQVLKSLGIDGSLKGAYKDLSGDFSGKYLDDSKEAATELKLTMYASTTADLSLKNNYSVISEYSTDPITTIGDSYISSARGGIYVEATVHIKFTSIEAKNNITAKGDIKYGSMVELAGSLKKLDETTKTQMSIEVELKQKGGDSSEIYSSLSSVDGVTGDANSLYLSGVNLDNAAEVIDRIQDYIGGKDSSTSLFRKQIHKYMNDPEKGIKITKYADVSQVFLSPASIKATKYSNAKTSYSANSKLRTAVDNHNGMFTTLLKEKTKYYKYQAIVASKAGLYDNQPKALADRYDDDEEYTNVTNNMIEKAKSCYGLVPKEDENDCISLLQEEVTQAKDFIKKLDAKGWQKAFYLRSSNAKTPEADNSDIEYLIPVGGDSTGEYFMTYSALPSLAIYLPGSEYKWNKTTKELSAKSVVTPTDATTKDRSLKFTLEGFDPLTRGLTGVKYNNLKDVSVTPEEDRLISGQNTLTELGIINMF